MRIAVLAHVRHPVRPPFMGGMEGHAWHLVRALTAKGHDVTLFAAGDSDAGDAKLVPVLDVHYDRDFPWHDNHGTEALNRHVDAGFAVTMRDILDGGFDVVHNNSLHRYPPRLARQHKVPMVTSLHVPPFDALRRAVHESPAPWSRFTVTSQKQVGSWWPVEEAEDGTMSGGPPEPVHVVHNGISLRDWPLQPKGDGSAVWAGRIAPNKGTHFAVTAAQFARVPLTIYGPIERQDYFDRMVAPYLSDTIRYGGHLPQPELAKAMGKASVAVFTPMWDEPFGLAAVEAMACGLPIASIDNGAAREVIGEEAGRFARPNEPAALGIAMTKAMRIPRSVPHLRVQEKFTVERMVQAYERVYRAAREGLSGIAPKVEFPAIELSVADPAPMAAE